MRLVAVTMLRDHAASRSEFRDAIDMRWSRFLAACGLAPLLLPNHPALADAMLRDLDPAGVLLTGGGTCGAMRGDEDDRDRTERAALDWSQAQRRPCLGVCRGMQVMLLREGGRLESVAGHTGREHAIRCASGSRTVNSFHDYACVDVPGHYQVDARSEDGVVEAVSCRERGRWGIMWHPERRSSQDTADVLLFQSVFAGRA